MRPQVQTVLKQIMIDLNEQSGSAALRPIYFETRLNETTAFILICMKRR